MLKRRLEAIMLLAGLGCWPPAAHAQATEAYAHIDLQSIANHPLDWLVSPPASRVDLGGVPFEMRRGPLATFATKAQFQKTLPTTATLTLDVANPTAIHIVISGVWVSHLARSEQVGLVTLGFDNGRRFTVPLINDENIRETWEYGRDLSSSWDHAVAGTRSVGAWIEPQRRGGKPARAYLDVLTIDIPRSLQESRLRSIVFTDAEASELSSLAKPRADAGLVVAAVTVRHR